MWTAPSEMGYIQRLLLVLAFAVLLKPEAKSQQVTLPPVNLGDTSFLDGIALPGWLVEEIGQGVHDGKATDLNGNALPGKTDITAITSLTHVAWISHAKVFGGWYGGEIVVSAAHVNLGTAGDGGGIGDITVGPLILQWPQAHLFKMPIYQRAVLDFDLPTGKYSPSSSVNIGSNQWDVQPYYAFTLFPVKRLETSWRIHYLWNSKNSSPPAALQAQNIQAGQAVHLNSTLSFRVFRGLYVGADGYYLKQITDHQINGRPIRNSEQQIGSIGPGAVIVSGKWLFFLNAYHEIGGQNIPEGNKVVLRLAKAF